MGFVAKRLQSLPSTGGTPSKLLKQGRYRPLDCAWQYQEHQYHQPWKLGERRADTQMLMRLTRPRRLRAAVFRICFGRKVIPGRTVRASIVEFDGLVFSSLSSKYDSIGDQTGTYSMPLAAYYPACSAPSLMHPHARKHSFHPIVQNSAPES